MIYRKRKIFLKTGCEEITVAATSGGELEQLAMFRRVCYNERDMKCAEGRRRYEEGFLPRIKREEVYVK